MIQSRTLAKSQGGFTLIELVVVIVILGILAAFAVPRFMGMEGRARASTVNGLAGSLRAAAAMAHGVWLADGTNAASLPIEGQTVAFVGGYPSRANIDLLIQDTSGFAYTAANGQFRKNGAPQPQNCRVAYNNAAGGQPPLVIVTATGAGCGF
jgi:MSHA pilin protein MshA